MNINKVVALNSSFFQKNMLAAICVFAATFGYTLPASSAAESLKFCSDSKNQGDFITLSIDTDKRTLDFDAHGEARMMFDDPKLVQEISRWESVEPPFKVATRKILEDTKEFRWKLFEWNMGNLPFYDSKKRAESTRIRQEIQKTTDALEHLEFVDVFRSTNAGFVRILVGGNEVGKYIFVDFLTVMLPFSKSGHHYATHFCQ